MKIAVIGTGYVGLVSGACFSEFGVDVVCVDTDAGKIAALKDGRIPIFEPGLERIVETNASASRLTFSTDLAESVKGVDAVFIAVGTPSRRGDGHADLSYVHAAAREVARALTDYAVIVTKSTVPVGTGRDLQRIIKAERPDLEFDVASNPEFLREGSAIEDFLRPDRVVIGVETPRAEKVLRDLYRPLFLIQTPIVAMSIETAELTKYAANSFLALKIAYINEIANLCEAVGANVHDVSRAMGLDGRIGPKFLHPGPGFGGSCFPKDTRAFAQIGTEAGVSQYLIETVIRLNDARKSDMTDRIVAALGGEVAGKSVGILGLTFKPNTDDMRESPSLAIVPALVAMGASVKAYDPAGMGEARKLLPATVNYAESAYDAIDGSDICVVLTEWNEFRSLDPVRIKQHLRHPLMIDLRNIYDPQDMRAAGLTYESVGRP
ncbi:UDP-glucose/GDP-mannose dehydrogenase family protein [Fodinicurvata sp. EGI_FJ10296]|uniref:UDP-glucose dehydrogenase family protein n=1 Tax=Fodinicurvata sp. EGI_FJ10296 TaxID=3231908 RepID=UPI0034567F1D